MKKVITFIVLFPIEVCIRLWKLGERLAPKRLQWWLNQQYLNYGSRMLKHGAIYRPGDTIRAPRSKQHKLIVNMFYNFKQNKITYNYKGLNGTKRTR